MTKPRLTPKTRGIWGHPERGWMYVCGANYFARRTRLTLVRSMVKIGQWKGGRALRRQIKAANGGRR